MGRSVSDILVIHCSDVKATTSEAGISPIIQFCNCGVIQGSHVYTRSFSVVVSATSLEGGISPQIQFCTCGAMESIIIVSVVSMLTPGVFVVIKVTFLATISAPTNFH